MKSGALLSVYNYGYSLAKAIYKCSGLSIRYGHVDEIRSIRRMGRCSDHEERKAGPCAACVVPPRGYQHHVSTVGCVLSRAIPVHVLCRPEDINTM
jgi:hypothetical protein